MKIEWNPDLGIKPLEARRHSGRWCLVGETSFAVSAMKRALVCRMGWVVFISFRLFAEFWFPMSQLSHRVWKCLLVDTVKVLRVRRIHPGLPAGRARMQARLG